MRKLSDLTIGFILKIAAQVLLMDLLFVLGLLVAVIKCYKTLTAGLLLHLLAFSLPQKIEFILLCGFFVLIGFGTFIIRINSLCIGKKRTLLDCLYSSLYKSFLGAFYTLVFTLLLPLFSGALMLLLSELAQIPDIYARLPVFFGMIQTYGFELFEAAVILSLGYSLIRFPIVGIIYLTTKVNGFGGADENLRILKGNRWLFLKISAPLLALIFLINMLCYGTLLCATLTYILGALLCTTWVVLYQQINIIYNAQ